MDHRIPKKKQTPREQQLGYQGAGHVPPSGDADLAAYLSAAGISNETEVNAVTTVFEDLKISGIWDKLIYLFLCSPTSLSAALVNAKTAVSATNSGATHSSTGLSTASGNFFYGSEYNFSNLPPYDYHASMQVSDAGNLSVDNYYFGYYPDGANLNYMHIYFRTSDNRTFGGFGNAAGDGAFTPNINVGEMPNGFYLLNVHSNTSCLLIYNNIPASPHESTNKADFTTQPTAVFPIGNCYNQSSGYGTAGGTITFKSFTAGFRLTIQQQTDLYDIITTYNTALGRA